MAPLQHLLKACGRAKKASRKRVAVVLMAHYGRAAAVALPGTFRPFRAAISSAGLGRRQVVRQRILIPPYGGSNPPAPASPVAEFKSFISLSRMTRRCHSEILFPPRRLRRNSMRVPLPRCRERPFHRPFGETLVSPAFVCRKSSALSVGELSFFEFGHAAVAASIESEGRREFGLLA